MVYFDQPRKKWLGDHFLVITIAADLLEDMWRLLTSKLCSNEAQKPIYY